MCFVTKSKYRREKRRQQYRPLLQFKVKRQLRELRRVFWSL